MNRDVRLYDGSTVHISCNDDKLSDTLYSVMIKPFEKAFASGWLASGERGMQTENRIKNYMDYVATLMIRNPDEHNVLGHKKVDDIKANESTAGHIDDARKILCVDLAKDPDRKRKSRKRTKTTHEKIDTICRANPGNYIGWFTVDTYGFFTVSGTKYRVIDPHYSGKKMGGWDGLYYEFDKVFAVYRRQDDAAQVLRVYDQNCDLIEDKYIKKGT